MNNIPLAVVFGIGLIVGVVVTAIYVSIRLDRMSDGFDQRQSESAVRTLRNIGWSYSEDDGNSQAALGFWTPPMPPTRTPVSKML